VAVFVLTVVMLSTAEVLIAKERLKLVGRLIAFTAVPGILVLAAVFIIRVDVPSFSPSESGTTSGRRHHRQFRGATEQAIIRGLSH
jgi:hypothetical protein